MRQARGGDKAAIAEEALAARGHRRRCRRAARRAPCRVPEDAPDALRDLSPLTAKPVLFVANVDEGDDDGPGRRSPSTPRRRARSRSRSRSRLEAELTELDDEEAAAMRADLGVARVRACSASSRRVRAAAT